MGGREWEEVRGRERWEMNEGKSLISRGETAQWEGEGKFKDGRRERRRVGETKERREGRRWRRYRRGERGIGRGKEESQLVQEGRKFSKGKSEGSKRGEEGEGRGEERGEWRGEESSISSSICILRYK